MDLWTRPHAGRTTAIEMSFVKINLTAFQAAAETPPRAEKPHPGSNWMGSYRSECNLLVGQCATMACVFNTCANLIKTTDQVPKAVQSEPLNATNQPSIKPTAHRSLFEVGALFADPCAAAASSNWHKSLMEFIHYGATKRHFGPANNGPGGPRSCRFVSCRAL